MNRGIFLYFESLLGPDAVSSFSFAMNPLGADWNIQRRSTVWLQSKSNAPVNSSWLKNNISIFHLFFQVPFRLKRKFEWLKNLSTLPSFKWRLYCLIESPFIEPFINALLLFKCSGSAFQSILNFNQKVRFPIEWALCRNNSISTVAKEAANLKVQQTDD